MSEKAIGGSDVCHMCAAHCAVIEDLEAALRWAVAQECLPDWALYAPQSVAITLEVLRRGSTPSGEGNDA